MLNLSYSDNKNIIVRKNMWQKLSEIITKVRGKSFPKTSDNASDAHMRGRELMWIFMLPKFVRIVCREFLSSSEILFFYHSENFSKKYTKKKETSRKNCQNLLANGITKNFY